MQSSEPIVNVTRGSLTESVHQGHISVVNAVGQPLYQLGNPSHKTFARSTSKLFQALPLIELGALDYFKCSPEEIALICASHNGEAAHVSAVQSILDKVGIDASSLQCGIHEPQDKKTRIEMRIKSEQPTPLHNNCSGKHAGMLALAVYLQASLIEYMSAQHPVQQRMLETICKLAVISKDQVLLSVDGCGVPVYGLNINQLALAFARFGDPKDLQPSLAAACKRVIHAVTCHPFYLAGSGRFDTRLIEITKGRIIGKMGAEGIYGITIPSSSMGLVVKVEDGANRALYPTVIETLRQLYLLNESELVQLADFYTPTIKNRRGEIVGHIKPSFKLRKL